MGEEDKLKMEERLKEKEMSTEDDIDKPELTAFFKFCARHGINANLIMLKITLFVMYGGKKRQYLGITNNFNFFRWFIFARKHFFHLIIHHFFQLNLYLQR